MIKTEDRQIGKVTYSVTQLGFKKSREVFARLTKMLGPALGLLLNGGSEGAAGALEAVCAQVSEADLEYLCDVFAECTMVKMPDGKRAKLSADAQELLFGGALVDCFKWLAFALEVNYGDFFDVFKGAQDVVAPQAVVTALP